MALTTTADDIEEASQNNPSELSTALGINVAAAKTGQANNTSLQSNCVYDCTIVKADQQTKALTVTIPDIGQLDNCTYISGAMAPMLGVEDVQLPAPGTSAILFHVGACNYVLPTLSGQPERKKVFRGRATARLKGDDMVHAASSKGFCTKRSKNKKQATIASRLAPSDVFPGESSRSNGLGVLVNFLMNLHQISAGGLAKIETHLFNDMVRIVSNYYVHHSCGGDEMIWSMGHPTWEQHFTSYQHEAEGKKEKTGELAKKGTAAWDPEETTQDRGGIYSATGRWRYSRYVGFLGDMIHYWVTSPTKVYSTFMEGAERAGNFRCWVGADGTYMLQAAAGIHMRVTRNIVIPELHKVWNDPELELKDEDLCDDLNDKYLKIWGKGPKWDDLLVSCWQMRHYLRYISTFHSLERFRQLADKHPQFCKVPTEAEAKPNEAAADEEDKKKHAQEWSHNGEGSVDVYPDGTIQLQSGGTMTITMNQGNIQIAAPGNIELKAGHTLSLSGKFVSIQSALDMELVSLFGKFTTKAVTAWKALCSKGRLWLKSDAPWQGRSGNQTSNVDGDDESPLQDMQNRAELNKYSVVIEAPSGAILSKSMMENVVHSDSGDTFLQAISGKTAVLANRQLQLECTGGQYEPPEAGGGSGGGGSSSPGDPEDKGRTEKGKPASDAERPAKHEVGSILIKGTQVGVDSQIIAMDTPKFKINRSLLIREARIDYRGNLFMQGKAQINDAVTIGGGILINGGIRAMGGYISKVQEHVAKFEDMEPAELDEVNPEDEQCDKLIEEAKKALPTADAAFIEPELTGPFKNWSLRDWDVMSGTKVAYWRSYKQAPYEDAIAHDGYDDATEFVEVKPGSEAQGGNRTSSKAPWPGKRGKFFKFNGNMDTITVASGNAFSDNDIKGVKDMQAVQYSWHVLKTSTDPVLFKRTTD